MNTCRFCLEALTLQGQLDHGETICGRCSKALHDLSAQHRKQMQVDRKELMFQLRAQAPKECPHCKGTGMKPEVEL